MILTDSLSCTTTHYLDTTDLFVFEQNYKFRPFHFVSPDRHWHYINIRVLFLRFFVVEVEEAAVGSELATSPEKPSLPNDLRLVQLLLKKCCSVLSLCVHVRIR